MYKRTAGEDDAGKRFDVVARKAFPALPLGQIFKAIRSGKLALNEKKVLGNTRITAGDSLVYYGKYHDNHSNTLSLSTNTPKIIPLWENNDLALFNKPVGIKIHDGDESMTALVQQSYPASTSLSFNIGPCHRLDRNTSGLVMFAKTAQGARTFMNVQKTEGLCKYYLAIIRGQLRYSFSAINHLARQNQTSYVVSSASSETSQLALTTFYPLCSNIQASLVLCRLHTGRTHQIRAVSAYYGYPLINDAKYSLQRSHSNTYYALHACALYSKDTQLPLKVICLPHHKEFSILLNQYDLPSDWVNKLKATIHHDGLLS